MYEPLDGPSLQGVLSVGTGALVIARIGAASFTDRKALTVQPKGNIYIFFANDQGSAPTVGDVSSKGFIHYKNAKETYEVGPRQIVYLLSVAGTVDVILAERA